MKLVTCGLVTLVSASPVTAPLDGIPHTHLMSRRRAPACVTLILLLLHPSDHLVKDRSLFCTVHHRRRRANNVIRCIVWEIQYFPVACELTTFTTQLIVHQILTNCNYAFTVILNKFLNSFFCLPPANINKRLCFCKGYTNCSVIKKSC